jgi:hypothetical protein
MSSNPSSSGYTLDASGSHQSPKGVHLERRRARLGHRSTVEVGEVTRKVAGALSVSVRLVGAGELPYCRDEVDSCFVRTNALLDGGKQELARSKGQMKGKRG